MSSIVRAIKATAECTWVARHFPDVVWFPWLRLNVTHVWFGSVKESGCVYGRFRVRRFASVALIG